MKVLLDWLRRFRAYLANLLHGLIGPPVEALRRALEAFFARMGAGTNRFLAFWRFLFMGPAPDEEGNLTPPTRSALLLASLLLALTLYTWPARFILPPFWFILVSLVLLAAYHRSIQFASLRGAGGRWERFLRETERRVGLVWWERLGAVLGLVLSLASAIGQQWSLLPLTVGGMLGFVVLLGQPPDERELRPVRALPVLPPPLPDLPPAPTRTPDGEDAVEPEPDRRGDYVRRDFSWTVRRAAHTDSQNIALYLHEPTYQEFREINPGPRWEGEVPRFDLYVVAGTTPDIDRAASALHQLSQGSRYSTYEEICSILAFVQAIEYARDIDTMGADDYWRYPIETLYDQTGDCEDSTILAGALLRRLGHDVVALNLPRHAALGVGVPEGVPGHFLVHNGRRMYYCETTAEGWAVGELPERYNEAEVTLVPIPPYVP